VKQLQAADSEQLSVSPHFSIFDGVVTWEIRGVSHFARWSHTLESESGEFNCGGASWQLYVHKKANSSELNVGLKLLAREDFSRMLPNFELFLAHVDSSLTAKRFSSGFQRISRARLDQCAVRLVTLEGNDFQIGRGFETKHGVSLTAVQHHQCYNAERDSILILCL